MTEFYTLRPDKFKDLRKQIILKQLPRVLIVTTVAIAISYYGSDDYAEESVIFWISMIVFLLVFQGILIAFGMKKYNKMLDSFMFTITETEVRREMNGTPTIRIKFENIKSIAKDKSGSFIIRGENKFDVITISAHIIKHEQLEKSLNQIREVELKDELMPERNRRIAYSAVTLVGMFIIYTSESKWLIGIFGTVVSIILAWTIIQIQTNKNVDREMKYRNYLMIAVLVFIVVYVYLKLNEV
jgi:hypothetical protein